MDKNTLTGFLLMAAVLFGFMYCNRPSETATSPAQSEQSANGGGDGVTSAVADTLAAGDTRALAEAVQAMGVATNDGYALLEDSNMSLRADSNSVRGTVKVGTTAIDVTKLLANAPIDSVTPEQRAQAVAAVKKVINDNGKYRSFARHLTGANKQVVLENELVKITLDTRGGRVSQAELKQYNTELTTPASTVKLFSDADDMYSFTFTTADQRLDTREFNFTPVAEGDSAVVMGLRLGDSSMWGIRYTLHPDSYVLSMEIVQQGMDKVLPASTSSMTFNWHQKLARNERGRTFEERNSAIYYKYAGDSPDDLSANADDAKELNERVKWVAFKSQFFSSIVIARGTFAGASLASVKLDGEHYLKDMTMSATVPYTVADGGTPAFDLYFGPNDYNILGDLSDSLATDGEDLELTELIPLGWSLFRWISTLIIIPVFSFLGEYITNYGVIILLLTLFIKLIIFPFTYKSFKSQARMRVLSPEIKAINEKYPGSENALKRQQETMALYSKAGASPFSGCLPMLLQMPVLVAMFWFFPSAIELRGQSFLWASDLSAPDVILQLPFTIPFYGNHVSLFCLMMTVVNIIYTRINMQNQPGGQSMPGMKWLMYLMPVMFLLWFNDYASGLSYYYFLSLLITIVQTWIFRRVVDEKKVRAEMAENAKKPRKKSGFMARLEAAQKQQQAAMRAQAKEQAKRRR